MDTTWPSLKRISMGSSEELLLLKHIFLLYQFNMNSVSIEFHNADCCVTVLAITGNVHYIMLHHSIVSITVVVLLFKMQSFTNQLFLVQYQSGRNFPRTLTWIQRLIMESYGLSWAFPRRVTNGWSMANWSAQQENSRQYYSIGSAFGSYASAFDYLSSYFLYSVFTLYAISFLKHTIKRAKSMFRTILPMLRDFLFALLILGEFIKIY